MSCLQGLSESVNAKTKPSMTTCSDCPVFNVMPQARRPSADRKQQGKRPHLDEARPADTRSVEVDSPLQREYIVVRLRDGVQKRTRRREASRDTEVRLDAGSTTNAIVHVYDDVANAQWSSRRNAKKTDARTQ